jgi:hypothetical protein
LTDHLTTLADIISQLADPQHHAESYSVLVGANAENRVHRIDMPCLVDQLAAEMEPGGQGADGRFVPASRPAARVESIDALERIRKGAEEWLAIYSGGERLKATLPVKLKRLVSAGWTSDQLRDLVKDAKRWLIWAQTITGWDSAPWMPNVPCMACNERGTLRIRLSASTAFCVACTAAWDASMIGLLAEGIRAANGERAAA